MVIPKLRFKNFNNEWEKVKVNYLLNERREQQPKSEEYPLMSFVKDVGVTPKEEKYDREFLVNDAENKKYKITKKGDFIYSSNNLESGSIGLNKYGNAVISPVYSIFSPTEKTTPEFIDKCFQRKSFIHNMVKWRQGVVYGQWKIHEKDFLNIEVYIPELEEQEKIGSFFKKLDEKISLQRNKIDLLEKLKKGLFSNIDDKNFKSYNLGDILCEKSEKTTINNQHDIISSTANGLFLQKEYFNKQAASENNIGYKILRKNQLVLSPQNLWMGNININDKYEVGIVSPSYKIYNINNSIVDIYYLKNWIKSPRALYDYLISSEQGASIVRRNLNIDLFNEITIKLPSLDEQKRIGKQLYNLEKKIELEEKKFEALNNIKKGLMQKMFI